MNDKPAAADPRPVDPPVHVATMEGRIVLRSRVEPFITPTIPLVEKAVTRALADLGYTASVELSRTDK